MESAFNTRIISTAEDYNEICTQLYATTFSPFEQVCRDRNVLFRYLELTNHNGPDLLHEAMPVFCIIGTLDSGRQGWEGVPNQIRLPRQRGNGTGRGDDRATAVEKIISRYAVAAEHVYIYVTSPRGSGRGKGARTRQTNNDICVERCTRPLVDGRYSVRSGIMNYKKLGEQMLRDFYESFNRRSFAQIISAPTPEPDIPYHRFAESFRAGYEPVGKLFDRLNDWYASSSGPAIITGEQKSGKTALFINWGDDLTSRYPGAIVIRHFVEADGSGHDHGRLLRHILDELHDQKLMDHPPPPAPKEMEDALAAWGQSRVKKKVLLIIDGLDRLAPDSRRLGWLPTIWSPNIRLLLSSAPGDAVETAHARDWEIISLNEFESQIKDARLRGWMKQQGDLTEQDIPRMERDPDQAPGSIENLMDIVMRSNPEEALRNMLASLPRMRQKLLCLIWGSRRGLTIQELSCLLNSRLYPERKVREDLRELSILITLSGDMVTFTFREVKDAVQHSLISTQRAQKRCHIQLAEYFMHHPIAARRAEEAPWQCRQALEPEKLRTTEDLESLQTALEDPTMLAAMMDSGRAHELHGYWRSIGGTQVMATRYLDIVKSSLVDLPLSHATVAEPRERLQKLAAFFSECGMYREAAALLNWALDMHRTYDRKNRLVEAHLLAALGEVKRREGEYPEAISKLREARKLLLRLRGVDPLLAAQAANDLGLVMWEAGDRQALSYLLKALDGKRKAVGSNHPSTAETLNDLALVYHDQRKNYDAALVHYKEAIKIQRRHNPDHPAMATYLNNIAGTWNALGKGRVALRLYRQALALRERLLDSRHPNTLITRHNITLVSHQLGLLDDSEATCMKALHDILEALSDRHPQYLTVSISFGQMLRQLGKLDEAKQVLKEALGSCRLILGENHRLTAICMLNLAGAYRAKEEISEAIRHYDDAIRVWRALLAPDDPQIASTLRLCANVHLPLGAYWKAVAVLAEAYYIEAMALGPARVRTRDTWNRLKAAVGQASDQEAYFSLPEFNLALESLWNLARWADDHDLRDEARELLGWYIALHPDKKDRSVRDAKKRLARWRGGK